MARSRDVVLASIVLDASGLHGAVGQHQTPVDFKSIATGHSQFWPQD